MHQVWSLCHRLQLGAGVLKYVQISIYYPPSQHQEVSALGMMERGRSSHPGWMDVPLNWTTCIECGQCAAVCPTGMHVCACWLHGNTHPTDAIHERSQWREVLDLLESGRKTVVCQTAPAVRVTIGEEFGLPPGAITTGQLVSAQRQLGFKYVFDTVRVSCGAHTWQWSTFPQHQNFAADLTVLEEATELLNRLASKWSLEGKHAHDQSHDEEHSVLPMFSSCCPAWVWVVGTIGQSRMARWSPQINAVQKSYPELIPNISSCRSPQMMLASVIKRVWAPSMGLHADDVVNVSVMPCTAKKYEAAMDKFDNIGGGHKTLEYVLTTREFAQMLRHAKVMTNDDV